MDKEQLSGADINFKAMEQHKTVVSLVRQKVVGNKNSKYVILSTLARLLLLKDNRMSWQFTRNDSQEEFFMGLRVALVFDNEDIIVDVGGSQE